MQVKLLLAALFLAASSASVNAEDGASLAFAFRREVDRRLEVPQEAQARYARLLVTALKSSGTLLAMPQYILLVDRNPNVQAIFLYRLDSMAPAGRWQFVGASPVSSGKPGRFDYFVTPLGVFAHTLENKDFRAEGTRNAFGIRGYGRKGMRVFDFGWVKGTRGWGGGGEGQMRLLLHATDPDHLEHHLGEAKSKGCIRISGTLNTFIDHYGLLDADYEQALKAGEKLWVLRNDRAPTRWPGRYLVIIDSGSTERPVWSPKPVELMRLPRKKSGKQKAVP